MFNVLNLNSAKGLKEFPGLRGVEPLAVKLCDPCPLFSNVLLSEGHVPLGFLQMPQVHLAIHDQ